MIRRAGPAVPSAPVEPGPTPFGRACGAPLDVSSPLLEIAPSRPPTIRIAEALAGLAAPRRPPRWSSRPPSTPGSSPQELDRRPVDGALRPSPRSRGPRRAGRSDRQGLVGSAGRRAPVGDVLRGELLALDPAAPQAAKTTQVKELDRDSIVYVDSEVVGRAQARGPEHGAVRRRGAGARSRSTRWCATSSRGATASAVEPSSAWCSGSTR